MFLFCRSCRNRKDRVCQSSGSPAGPLRPGLQLRRDLRLPGRICVTAITVTGLYEAGQGLTVSRLPGDGPHLCGSVSGGRVGLFRRVQPSGGAHAVCCVSAGSVHPGGSEGTHQPQQRPQYVEPAQHHVICLIILRCPCYSVIEQLKG